MILFCKLINVGLRGRSSEMTHKPVHEILLLTIYASSEDSFEPAISHIHVRELGCVAQSVMCLTADTCLIADPGVVSSIQARFHTFMEIDHEI